MRLPLSLLFWDENQIQVERGQAALAVIFQRLLTYTVMHSVTEDHLMVESDYPEATHTGQSTKRVLAILR